MIGIIGAMSIEAEQLTAKLGEPKTRVLSGITFHSGRLCGHDVVIAVCGAGKVNAAVCTQLMITAFGADRIINTGIAGGLADGMRQGDFVVASAFVQHDMDTSAVGDPVGFISGINVIELPVDEKLSELLTQAARSTGEQAVTSGIVATGDRFIADRAESLRIAERFSAVACEMEGGAIAHVCYMAGVPFAAVRCISDNADGSAGLTYDRFRCIAADRSAGIVIKCLESMEQ